MNSVTQAAILSSGLDADVRAYAAAIAANGGSVSQQWLRSVNTFVQGCKSDGTWDSLLDVGLLCGVNDLNAALVKLKTFTGVSRILTNTNFISADYTASGATAGLLGNNAKWLDTNLSATSTPSTNLHYSVYLNSYLQNQEFFGVLGSGSGAGRVLVNPNVSGSLFENIGESGGVTANASYFFFSASSSGTSGNRYANGTNIGSFTSAAISGSGNWVIVRGPNSISSARANFYSIGTNLTNAQASALSNRVNTLMASIGANKY